MAWDVFVQSVEVSDGRIAVRCVLTDNVQKIPHVFTFEGATSIERVKSDIANFIAGVTSSADLLAQIPVGLFDITPAVIPPPDPTPSEIWFATLSRLRLFQQLIDLKVIQPDDQNYLDQLAIVQGTFKPDYVS